MSIISKLLEYGKQKIYTQSSEHMEQVEDESVDVIVTSPPYNIGKKYHSNNGIYNDRQPFDQYLHFLKQVFYECYRVLNPIDFW